MKQKPAIPKGTRDFSPAEVAKRQYIINIIKKNFEKFGFQPIETPSFENSDTLLGKYGDEGDRLIFKILNSGNYLDKIAPEDLSKIEYQTLSTKISEKALRYDLTVPFARYVVQHQNEIDFPFKRYQIQPVWRADKPQKGRFREFYQCDADVVGSNSLWQEVELIQLYDAIFYDLDLQSVTIKMNNRKILAGIAQIIGASDKLADFTIALDKIDKIGEEGVINELIQKKFTQTAINHLKPLFNLVGTNEEKFNKLSEILLHSDEGKKGIAELRFINENIKDLGLYKSTLDFDITLARGLNYYTGTIFEVASPKSVALGSIGGGGRYDNLTGIFGLPNMSGIGISLGLDRIYLVLETLNLFPNTVSETSKALFLNFGDMEAFYCTKAIKKLRQQDIKVELFPENVKLAKQFSYATARKIPYVVIAGETEMKEEKFILKNLSTGEQTIVKFDQLKEKLLNKLL